METLRLCIALSDNERTRPIAQGRFQSQGVRLIPTVVHPPKGAILGLTWLRVRSSCGP